MPFNYSIIGKWICFVLSVLLGGLFVMFRQWSTGRHIHRLITWPPATCWKCKMLVLTADQSCYIIAVWRSFLFSLINTISPYLSGELHKIDLSKFSFFLSAVSNFWPVFHNDRLHTSLFKAVSVWQSHSYGCSRPTTTSHDGRRRGSCCTVTDPDLRPQRRAGNGPDNFPTGINKPSAQWAKEDPLC